MNATGRVTRLPPRSERTRDELAEVELLAWLLDNSIPIPGTGRRIGIDALIGFVPGLGDLISGGLGVLIVLRARQLGLPNVVIGRMIANLGLDLTIGAIPVLGDAFDLWFKANARNLGLMRRYVAEPGGSTRGQWLFLLGLLAALIAIAVLVAWAVASIIGWLVASF